MTLDDVDLVAPGSVSKTSSGKTQRHLCRSSYLRNRIQRWPRERSPSRRAAVA